MTSRSEPFSWEAARATLDGFPRGGLNIAHTRPTRRVYALLGRVPELYAAALGTRKAGMAFIPLFAALGPEPIRRIHAQHDP